MARLINSLLVSRLNNEQPNASGRDSSAEAAF
jgi:hypothetical protein